MKVYIARQPIYKNRTELYGYELLYRSNEKNMYDSSVEGNIATKSLLSEITSIFSLYNLTNQKSAFINFTKDILLSDLPNLLDPNVVIIEVLEDIVIDQLVINSVKNLKALNFKIALDDYSEHGPVDQLLQYADIVKVDFQILQDERRVTIAKDLKKMAPHIMLLAEKVETEEDVSQAEKAGYSLFQGYFFSRPIMVTKHSADIAESTSVRILQEINKPEPDYDAMADIIKVDMGMTYMILKQTNTAYNYRGQRITNVKTALARLGIIEVKRLIFLTLLRTISGNTEIVRNALVRAVFSESLAKEAGHEELQEEAFLTGMFSTIDAVLNEDMFQVLESVCLFQRVKDALLGKQNELKCILEYVKLFEAGYWEQAKDILEIENKEEHIADLYLEAMNYADSVFRS